MTGMDAATGRSLAGEAHLRQSVVEVLSTPIGARAMLRDFGAGVIESLGAPALAASPAIYAAAAEAMSRWEPRLELTLLTIREESAGHMVVHVEGVHREGDPFEMDVVMGVSP